MVQIEHVLRALQRNMYKNRKKVNLAQNFHNSTRSTIFQKNMALITSCRRYRRSLRKTKGAICSYSYGCLDNRILSNVAGFVLRKGVWFEGVAWFSFRADAPALTACRAFSQRLD